MWFDFDADYLFAGCNTCCDSQVLLSQSLYNEHYKYIPVLCSDLGLVQNSLFPSIFKFVDPFYDLYTSYSGARNIMLVKTADLPLLPGSRPSDFKEISERFSGRKLDSP